MPPLLPAPVRSRRPFLLTQVIVGINVLVFHRHGVFRGVASSSPPFSNLVTWGANARRYRLARSRGEYWRRTTFISG